jgi:hypothetical protein
MAKKKAGGKKRVTGGNVRGWRKKAFEELPTGSDQEVADRVIELARSEGFTEWSVSPEKVAAWRLAKSSGRQPRRARQDGAGVRRSGGGEGEAITVLRTLVQLIGKDEVKRVVDGL